MKYPWMPLFWGDFLANTMHLSAQEAGAYLFLIAHAWEHGGEIPGDRIRLARIAHVRRDRWKDVWKQLEPFFEPTISGPHDHGYRHHRVHDELQRLGKISNQRKAAAVQMHSKSNGFAPASTSTSNKESFLGNQAKVPPVHLHGEDFRDKGPEYRSPPAKKSDNVLAPQPDKQSKARK